MICLDVGNWDTGIDTAPNYEREEIDIEIVHLTKACSRV